MLMVSLCYAQEDWEDQGAIEDIQIVVEKDKKIELPRANRKFEKIDKIVKKEVDTKQSYAELVPKAISLNQVKPRLKVLKIQAERPKPLIGNYVELGFGNYITPYVNGYLNSTRNSEYAYGVNVNHISSSNGPVEYSGMSSSDVGVNGDYFLNNATLSGNLNYNNETFRYYGFNADSLVISDEKDITQSLNQISSSIGLKGSANSLKYDINGLFSTLSGKNDLSDLLYGYNSEFEFELADKSSLILTSELMMENASYNTLSNNRTYFSANPSYKFLHDGIHVTAGLNTAYDNDMINGGSGEFHIYPHVFLNYPLFINELNVFGGVTGGIERNSYASLLNENRWFSMDSNSIFNNNKTIDFFGGLKGNFVQKLGYKAQLSFKNYQNLHFYINNQFDSTRFDIVTDNGNTTMFSFTGEMNYEISKKMLAELSLEYNSYGLSTLDAAYHRPNLIIGLNTNYNIQDKLLLKTQFNYISGLKGANSLGTEIVELNDIIDLNIELDYKISDKFSSFVMLNNIFGAKYQYYSNYQTKGINAILGVSYSF